VNAADVAALRLACAHVEDHRLAAMADVVAAGGTLTDATDAVRTDAYFGALTDAGEVHATRSALRVRVADGGPGELSVTWTAVAAALMPALRGDLGVDVVASYDARRRPAGLGVAAHRAALHRWRHVKTRLVAEAFATVAVQASLFDPPTHVDRGGVPGRSGPRR
jgi:hypothetical protein